MHNFIDRTGQKFGKLTVLRRAPNGSGRDTKWECLCDCGTLKIIIGDNLKGGKTKSCGCSQARTTHGDWGSPEYTSWASMIDRCTNQNRKQWKDYGGRGITVCKEWLNDYSAFLAYMERRPTLNHSLDRYPNNDGNYEPGNVRWATKEEQNNNQRRPTG